MEEKSEEDIFCVNCGVPIDEGTTICGLCGPYPLIDQGAGTYPRPSRMVIIVVIGLVVTILLTVFVLAGGPL